MLGLLSVMPLILLGALQGGMLCYVAYNRPYKDTDGVVAEDDVADIIGRSINCSYILLAVCIEKVISGHRLPRLAKLTCRSFACWFALAGGCVRR